MSNQIKCELQSWMGNDRQISEAAWTSSYSIEQKELRTEKDVERVVNMLADSKHSVPFESVVFRFWFRLPIAADRQLMTHRIASHSGMSGRYRTMPSEFLEMPDDILLISKKAITEDEKHLGGMLSHNYLDLYNKLCESANHWYNQKIEGYKEAKKKGYISDKEYKRVREFIRGVLPQHNLTERTTIMNLRSFANFYKLRSKEDAQPEIRYISQLMLQQIKDKNICPVAISALERNNWII